MKKSIKLFAAVILLFVFCLKTQAQGPNEISKQQLLDSLNLAASLTDEVKIKSVQMVKLQSERDSFLGVLEQKLKKINKIKESIDKNEKVDISGLEDNVIITEAEAKNDSQYALDIIRRINLLEKEMEDLVSKAERLMDFVKNNKDKIEY